MWRSETPKSLVHIYVYIFWQALNYCLLDHITLVGEYIVQL